jgi:hypothetical protein
MRLDGWDRIRSELLLDLQSVSAAPSIPGMRSTDWYNHAAVFFNGLKPFAMSFAPLKHADGCTAVCLLRVNLPRAGRVAAIDTAADHCHRDSARSKATCDPYPWVSAN